MIATAQGASIEGEIIEIQARQIYVRTPRKINNITHHTFRTGINSQATVSRELNPKVSIISTSSMLDVGDQLVAASVEGHGQKQIPRQSVVQGSHRHKAQAIQIRRAAYAKIAVPKREALARNVKEQTKPSL